MTDVTSKDGTRIAFDSTGDGPTVILVAGAFQFRGFDPETVELAKDLAAEGYKVINYDRRGRGESVPARSFTLQDEVDDLAALIEAAGGRAALFGNSSGGSISLAAAAAGLPITKLALWELPLGAENGTDEAESLKGLRERIDAGDQDGVVEYFMKDMPAEWLAGAKSSPAWPVMTAIGPSLSADTESLAWTQSAPRSGLWASVTQPALILVGEQTQPIMTDAAASMVSNLPNARSATIPGANHSPDRAALVAALAGFLAD